MKKQVVVLMNGFGIEQKRSYAIYDSFLMPNLDGCTKEFFFSTLESESYDAMNGYQFFSTGTDTVPSYLKLDNWLNEQIKFDPKMIEYKKKFDTITGNIHLFCVLSNKKTFNHIKEFLTYLNPLKQKKIYLHVILDFPFIDDYKKIGELLTKLNYELDDLATLKIVVGKNIIEDNPDRTSKDIVRLLYKKFGEQWRELTQKMDVLYKTKVAPNDVKAFCTDAHFELNDQDTILFFNYDLLKVNDFIEFVSNPNVFMNAGKEIHSLSFQSIFPCTNGVPSIYEKNISENSFAKSLEQLGKKALIVTEKEKVNETNFYLNGCENRVSPSLRYMSADTSTLERADVLNQILTNEDDVIVLNYFLGETNNTEEFKNKLRTLDQIFPIIKNICEEKDYTLWITSFYGVRKEMLTNKKEKVLVDFNGKVPLIFFDRNYLKNSYKLLKGNLYDFQLTMLYLMNPTPKAVSLIGKKGLFG